MPRGASPKREREYEELLGEFKREGRYKGRQKEVAARIVNKQRSMYGETKTAKDQHRRGRSSDRDLPIGNYEHLTIPEIRSKAGHLSSGDKRQILNYEKKHKNRKGVIELLGAN